jgi:hypothetical protein
MVSETLSKTAPFRILEFFLTGKTQASEKHCSSDYIRLAVA